MPRDYAKKPVRKGKPATPRKTRKSKPSGAPNAWIWLLLGIAIGITLSIIVQNWNDPGADIVRALEDISVAESPPPKRQFEFHRLARESEVVVANVEPSPLRGTTSNSNGDSYLLQAGSFQHMRDADNLRARLLLLNLNARVEPTSTGPGEKWYRVLVGPYSSQSNLANARATLLQNGIDNLVLKRKKTD